jgi:nicotinamidase-related amidase
MHLADALDGQGLAGRRCAREPSSLENRFHPLHSSDASRANAEHVAALLHALARATREVLDLRLLELMAPLAALCPPATVIDKTRYSAFAEPRMIEHHGTRSGRADYLGIRTDVRVLATLLDAVDIGYRVIVVRDAICSSSDKGHDMLMLLYPTRYSGQIETADAVTNLARWE